MIEEEKESEWEIKYREQVRQKALSELPPKNDSAPHITPFEDIQEFLSYKGYVINFGAKETARFLKENGYTKKDIRGKARWNFDLGAEYNEFRKKYDKCQSWAESYGLNRSEIEDSICDIWFHYTHNRSNRDHKLRPKYAIIKGQEYFENPLNLVPGSMVSFVYNNGKTNRTECWLTKYLVISEEKISDELQEKLSLPIKMYKFLVKDNIIYHGFFEDYLDRMLITTYSHEDLMKLYENESIEIYTD